MLRLGKLFIFGLSTERGGKVPHFVRVENFPIYFSEKLWWGFSKGLQISQSPIYLVLNQFLNIFPRDLDGSPFSNSIQLKSQLRAFCCDFAKFYLLKKPPVAWGDWLELIFGLIENALNMEIEIAKADISDALLELIMWNSFNNRLCEPK